MTVILDPTNERVPVTRQVTPRTQGITGTVAFLDIRKPRGNVLIDQMETLLAKRLPDVQFKRFTKPTFTKPAPDDLRREVQESADFVVEALAD